MRSIVLFAACLVALSACSRPAPPADDKATPAADTSAEDARARALVLAVKQDVAAGFVATASDACAGLKGDAPPDPKTGAPVSFSAAGVIGWAAGSIDYAKEPGATVTVTTTRADKSFSFGAYIYDLGSRALRYTADLTQMPGQPMNATVKDQTKPTTGDARPATGTQCTGGTTPPALVTQGLWPVAARHLQVPVTPLSCISGRVERAVIEFSFDGKTLQAGAHRFTEADAAYSETLTVDPASGMAKVMYVVEKDDVSNASIGLSEAGVLSYATLNLPGNVHWACSPAR